MTSIWGLVWACVSTSLGGTTVVFTRMIMTETTPLSLTFARYGIALIILFALFLLRKEFIKFSRKDLMGLSIIAIFMYAGFPFCFARSATSSGGSVVWMQCVAWQHCQHAQTRPAPPLQMHLRTAPLTQHHAWYFQHVHAHCQRVSRLDL